MDRQMALRLFVRYNAISCMLSSSTLGNSVALLFLLAERRMARGHFSLHGCLMVVQSGCEIMDSRR